jgi:hypothetical protein
LQQLAIEWWVPAFAGTPVFGSPVHELNSHVRPLCRQ